MRIILLCSVLSFLMMACSPSSIITPQKSSQPDVTIAFGSCNDQNKENNIWDDVLARNPDVWIWAGDNVYGDTDDMQQLEEDYQMVLDNPQYQQLQNEALILATWDDHDYGKNDGGKEWKAKGKSQQAFLNFLGVVDPDRRQREGVYHSQLVETSEGSINIILLDTRYHRDSLIHSSDSNKKYMPRTVGEGSVLGEEQWQWFEEQLKNSNADFNIVVSSIQVFSDQHGYESWGLFPHEQAKLEKLIQETRAKNVIILSGDRHITEFSMKKLKGVSYPIFDFTSSGMTHTYSTFPGEENPHRVGEAYGKITFGVLEFDFSSSECSMLMVDPKGHVFQRITNIYR